MAVQLESAARLAALRDKADAVTGESSATLAGAVDALIAGYGQGDGDASVGLLDGTLTEYNNPKLTKIREYALYNNTRIQRLIARNCYDAGNNALRGCSALAFLDVALVNIKAGGFADDTNIKTIILRKSDGICILINTSAFNKTPFASGGTGGTVYVPSALIAQYQQATNWSTLYAAGTCSFAAIEGSEYE